MQYFKNIRKLHSVIEMTFLFEEGTELSNIVANDTDIINEKRTDFSRLRLGTRATRQPHNINTQMRIGRNELQTQSI
jgi:hypothetical protein